MTVKVYDKAVELNQPLIQPDEVLTYLTKVLRKVTGNLIDRLDIFYTHHELKNLLELTREATPENEEAFYDNYFQLIRESLATKLTHEPYPHFDSAYMDLILDVLDNGVLETDEIIHGEPQQVRGRYESDNAVAPTLRVLNRSIRLDNRKGRLNALTSKKQAVKDPLVELDWIWFLQSNDVDVLLERGCKVWKQWKSTKPKQQKDGYEIGEGTIGTSYGFQIGSKRRFVKFDETLADLIESDVLKTVKKVKVNDDLLGYTILNKDGSWGNSLSYAELENTEIPLNQLDYVIYALKSNPLSRRIKTTLFHYEDLDNMELEPCVYETHWQVIDGHLELTVNIRSNDMGLGHPYNVHQYCTLHQAIADVVGIPSKDIVFNIDNVHVYVRHLVEILNQLKGDFTKHIGKGKLVLHELDGNIYNFDPTKVEVKDYTAEKSRRFEIVV